MTDTRDVAVVFLPSGRRGRVARGATVLDAARALGVDVDSVCGGRGICGRCQVVPAIGDFPKLAIDAAADHLSPVGAAEEAYAREHGLAPGRRLGCVAALHGDAVIDVPPESQVHRQVVRKALDVRDFEIDPVIRLRYVDVEPARLASPRADLARLLAALEREWDVTGLDADLAVIRALPGALAAGDGRVTVAVHDDRTIIAVWPGFHEKAYGVAIDVGSTTIAGHLADLADGAVLASRGAMNPQIRYGEDLMSRVSYAMLHPGCAAEMTAAVRTALDKLVAGLASNGGVKRTDILALSIVGNPVMHHLLLGLDPTPLGTAPFTLATDDAVHLPARDLGIRVNEGARVYVLPCIAGHVGADTAGMILAERPDRSDHVRLLVDVGTNAEIVLGDARRLLAASSPTGPAFEGAQISAGQRAAPGAIERVRIDRDTLEPRFRVIGVDAWSDDPGFAAAAAATAPTAAAAATAGTGVTGICGSGIVEAIAELFLAGVVASDGTVDGRLAARTPRVVADGRTFAYVLHDGPQRIAVTQNDVRAIQLAKAALYAGARLLMDSAGVEAVDEIALAGAFGSQIDPVYAMVLGLIPDCDPARVRSAGNAAGTGALIALLSRAARHEIEEVVRRIEKVETAVEPRFQEHFVDAMAFPHGSAAYPRLARMVELPTPTPTRARESSGGRQRRRRAAVDAVTAKEET